MTDSQEQAAYGLAPLRARLIAFAAMALVAFGAIWFIDRRAMAPDFDDTVQYETPDEQLRLD